MAGAGFQPFIAQALRTPSEEAAHVANGTSQTMNSQHLAGPDGLSRAADVVDHRWGWSPPADSHYWLYLGRCALLHGLGWGGLFNLKEPYRQKLVDFLTDNSTPFHPANWMDSRLGFDPAHLQQIQDVTP
jgi:hypothetical protein